MKQTDNIETSNGEMVTISRAEYEEFQAQRKKISELESRVDVLMEALRLARHKQFGASSEKSEETLTEQLSFLFNEAEVFSAADKEEAENVTVVAAYKRHKKHEYTLDNIPEGMPTKQVEHRLEGEDLVCPQCGDTMTEIGKEVVRTLEIIPAQTVVREDIYYTYACKSCNESADKGCETPVVKAPREKNIIPG
ncbi:MAG: IS66 family transposase zinc-finger binding domain-containing protein, partial [Oscillospiraceae bacterium]|nr:IS66 family transposase zinc-finger binding domain-containing protein [Oscillospiraceae bacterium]